MGTQLFAHGVGFDQCFDALNLSQPALVQKIHREYIKAGAEMVETNTFGASRVKLREHGLQDQVTEINRAGVELARAVVSQQSDGRARFVLASVGPLGRRLQPLGQISLSEAQDVFREQVAALAEAGPDALIIETMSDLNEIRAAIRAARQVTRLPIIAQMTFAEDGRTLLGHSPQEFVEAMREFDVAVVGANCSVGPGRLVPVVEAILQVADGIRVSVQPNAGWPEQVGDRLIYPSSPDYFAQFARRAVESGVSIVGGCCGTTPEHIRAMRRALDALATVDVRAERVEVVSRPAPSKAPAASPTRLAQSLAAGKFVVSVEVDPPRSGDASPLLDAARFLEANGVDVLNVADTPMARMRMSPWALCTLVQSQVGLETVLHFPTRGRNLLRVMGDLLAAHALGVRNIFVVMGDPPSHGDYPQATDHSDIVPSGLVRLVKDRLNTGLDAAGQPIAQATSFHVGVAVNMAAPNPAREIALLKRKIDAGADFAMTQPVYDPAVCRNFIRRLRERLDSKPIPILMGLLPLAGTRHAEFLHNELPGFSLPESVRERMRRAGSKGRSEGTKLAQEVLLEAREGVQGVYVMPAFERWQTVIDVISVLPSPR